MAEFANEDVVKLISSLEKDHAKELLKLKQDVTSLLNGKDKEIAKLNQKVNRLETELDNMQRSI